MELASPTPPDETTATTVDVAKGINKKGTTIDAIDREHIFRCMTAPDMVNFDSFNSGGSQRLFNGLMGHGAVYG
jgi:hypothetical protein